MKRLPPDPSRPHPSSSGNMSRRVHFDKLPCAVQSLVKDMPVWMTEPALLEREAVTIYVPENLATEDDFEYCLLDPGMDECFLREVSPTDHDPLRRQWPKPGKGFGTVTEKELLLRLGAHFFDTQEQAEEYFRHDPITIVSLRRCLLARPEGTQKLLSLFGESLSSRAARYVDEALNSIAPQLTALDVIVVLDAIDLERSSYSLQNLGNGYFEAYDFKHIHLRSEITKNQLLFRLDRAIHRICVAKTVFPELVATSPNIRFTSLVGAYIPKSSMMQW